VAESAPLWLYLHFPLLALEAQQVQPGVAVLLDERGQRLRLCSYEAVQAGLEPGLASATAYSICPELEVFRPHPARLQQQLESLALWAGSFSAQIVLYPPEGLLLEIATMLQYFGGLERFIQQLQARLSTQGFKVRYATGHTPLAARLLARSERPRCLEGRAAHLNLLQALPIEQLEIPPRQQTQLRGMGLLQLAQLQALPRDALGRRFGRALLEYLDRITGQRPDPQTRFEPPPLFQQHHEFSREVEHSLALLFPLHRMLEALAGYLQLRGLLAVQLELTLVERDGGHELHPLGHAAGSADAETWLTLCRLRLEQVRLSRPVVALQLEVERFKTQAQHNTDLFTPSAPVEHALDLLSRLQVRLGEGAVQPVSFCADHRPEYSVKVHPCSGANRAVDKIVQVPPGERPGWLLQTPQPLAAGLPAHIELLAGPERISSGWWDQHPVRRDYYIARWRDGRRGWLFRDAQGKWFVHGWFG
jgi:protein ImuB